MEDLTSFLIGFMSLAFFCWAIAGVVWCLNKLSKYCDQQDNKERLATLQTLATRSQNYFARLETELARITATRVVEEADHDKVMDENAALVVSLKLKIADDKDMFNELTRQWENNSSTLTNLIITAQHRITDYEISIDKLKSEIE